MNLQTLKENIEGIDIYVLDQILKERYNSGQKIIDVGCGTGRNLKWFYNNDFKIYGTDINTDALEVCKQKYTLQQNNFITASANNMPFDADSFDHILCNAVLHFAKNESHFYSMLNELLRILKSKGSLFIRIASNFGLENQVELIENGVYKLPDGSTRFLLTAKILAELQKNQSINWLEDVKTTIVQNKRCMTTLVVQKK